jgi:hypothetical protein
MTFRIQAMNCNDIANLLDEHRTLNLSPFQQDEIERHVAVCEDCRNAARAARVLHSYGEAPTPAPRQGFMEAAMRQARIQSRTGVSRRSFWRGAAFGGALAASLAIAAVLLLPADSPNPGDERPAVRMALNEMRNVSVAIASAQALRDVDIRVELSGGIRLDRADGRRSVTWRTDLAAGMNRLTVPVAAVDRSGGDIQVELIHAAKRKRLSVHVDVGDPDLAKSPEPDAASRV